MIFETIGALAESLFAAGFGMGGLRALFSARERRRLRQKSPGLLISSLIFGVLTLLMILLLVLFVVAYLIG